jgi:hypothetical protein
MNIARCAIEATDQELRTGLHYNTIFERVSKMNERIRWSDLTAALQRLNRLQEDRQVPPWYCRTTTKRANFSLSTANCSFIGNTGGRVGRAHEASLDIRKPLPQKISVVFVSSARYRYLSSPLTFIYICFVDPIALIGRLKMRSAAFVQLWRICLHPAPNATGVQLDTTFGHQFADVLVGERIAEIPAHAQNDHVSRVLVPFERIAHIDRHGLLPCQEPVFEVRNGTLARVAQSSCGHAVPGWLDAFRHAGEGRKAARRVRAVHKTINRSPCQAPLRRLPRRHRASAHIWRYRSRSDAYFFGDCAGVAKSSLMRTAAPRSGAATHSETEVSRGVSRRAGGSCPQNGLR